MEDRLRICEQAKELAMEECRGLKIKICEQDNDNRKSRLELATQVDDLCNKVRSILIIAVSGLKFVDFSCTE